jgi:hypothetical protein
MILIRNNEALASRRVVYFFCSDDDAADAYAPKSALTFTTGDLKISKNGGAWTNASGTTANGQVVNLGNGWYSYAFSVLEIDTLGTVGLFTNVVDVYSEASFAQVVAFNPYDISALGLTFIDAAVSTRLPTASYEGADAFLDKANGVETGVTLRQALRLLASVIGGRTTGSRTGVVVTRNLADTKNVVTATIDSSGNRTALTRDLT